MAPPPDPNQSTSEFPSSEDQPRFTFIIEHLDPELGAWSALEYRTIVRECRHAGPGCGVLLSSVPKSLVPEVEKEVGSGSGSGLGLGVGGEGGSRGEGIGGTWRVESRGVEELFPPVRTTGGGVGGEEAEEGRKGKVGLLDPQAERELSPEDGERFEGFLFGGILGDDPPRDRTSELRTKGYEGRRLGPKQMTTDTAVRVTRMVVLDKVPLDAIPYVDFPELKLTEHERAEMPFRYVRGADGEPVMPEGMIELIAKDADKGFEDFV